MLRCYENSKKRYGSDGTLLFRPSSRRRLPGNLGALLRAQLRRPRLAALEPAPTSQRHGSWIAVVRHGVLRLAGGNVPDQLGECNGVAGSLLASLSHDPSLADAAGDSTPISATGF